MKICVTTASLGGFDSINKSVEQTIPYDYYAFTDENFPPRFNAMTPRLQSKIPKMFSWQLKPDYDYYMWLDGNITFARPDSLEYFYNQCKDYDIVVFKHNSRPDIRQENRHTRKGVDQKAIYLYNRYRNEWYEELYKEIQKDKTYVDDYLVMGGAFMYKNTPKVQEMLKNWWYYNSRYVYQDQISLAYVIRKANLKVNILSDNMLKTPYLMFSRHRMKK